MFSIPISATVRRLPRLMAMILSIGVLLCAPARGGAAAKDEDGPRAKITAIRHWTLSDVTRVVVESSGEFRFKSERLQSPDRLFFDLLNTRPQIPGQGSKGLTVISVGDRFLKQIRFAETQPGVTRIVFDLELGVEYSTSQLANPDRLIIELHSTLMAVERGRLLPEREQQRDSIPAPPSRRMDYESLIARRQGTRKVRQATIPDAPSAAEIQFIVSRITPRTDALVQSSLSSRLPVRATFVSKPTPERAVAATAPPPKSQPGPSAPPTRKASEPEAPEPAKRNPNGSTMTRVLGLKLGRVVLDPGHGGRDAGTSGSDGLHEKDIVLDIAKRLGGLLEERLGSEVIYTRTDDSFVGLTRRPEIANEKKADLFLSIHVNSSPFPAVSGFETYYLSFTATKSSLDTATRENAGANKGVGELQDLLKKIALNDKLDESKEFAGRIQTSLVNLAPKATRVNKDRGIKRAPFVVLIGASMPAVLAEVGFISNPQEETQLSKPEQRQKIAEALYRGVAGYANSLSHFQVAQTGSNGKDDPNEPEQD